MKLAFTSRSFHVCASSSSHYGTRFAFRNCLCGLWFYVDFKIILLLLCMPSAKAYRQKTLLHKIPVLNWLIKLMFYVKFVRMRHWCWSLLSAVVLLTFWRLIWKIIHQAMVLHHIIFRHLSSKALVLTDLWLIRGQIQGFYSGDMGMETPKPISGMGSWSLPPENYWTLMFCRFWCILTTIRSLVLADH